MGILDKFNDKEDQISLGNGKYRVLQVVLREKNLLVKDQRILPKLKTYVMNNLLAVIACILSLNRQQPLPVLEVATEPLQYGF